MPKPPLVYIAAPYSQRDPVANTHQAIRIADALLDAGVAPIVPHLSLLWHLVSPKPYERWLEYDRHLLRRCDAVLRVPGDSAGATEETYLALRLQIPVLRPASAAPNDCVAVVADWRLRCRAGEHCHSCDRTSATNCLDCVRCLVCCRCGGGE